MQFGSLQEFPYVLKFFIKTATFILQQGTNLPERLLYSDANENDKSFATESFNRYPDPLQWQLKFSTTRIKGVLTENIC